MCGGIGVKRGARRNVEIRGARHTIMIVCVCLCLGKPTALNGPACLTMRGDMCGLWWAFADDS